MTLLVSLSLSKVDMTSSAHTDTVVSKTEGVSPHIKYAQARTEMQLFVRYGAHLLGRY